LGWKDAEVEDVVQDAFLLAYAKLDQFTTEHGLGAWLNRFCVYLCLERLRARRRLDRAEAEDLEALAEARTRHLREDEARRAARLEWLWGLAGQLGEACGRLLRLRDRDGLAYAQIARQQRLPLGTVMSRLNRCRQRLKRLAAAQEEAAP
jgi:RNA polymerase sigma-70 factor (ECF subfamily)